MREGFRPILGVSMFNGKRWREFEESRLPALVTPKIDGIRLVTVDLPCGPEEQCVPLTRALKRLPSCVAYEKLARECPPGLDGELVGIDVRGNVMPFHATQSLLMSENAPNVNFRYYVFDLVDDPQVPYHRRVENLQKIKLPCFCVKLLPHLVKIPDEMRSWEQHYLQMGYEGMCYRVPMAPYKYGRSTWREQYLVKVKRFENMEGRVVGFTEMVSNHNIPRINALGYMERSSCGENLRPMNTLGALIVKSPNFMEPFLVGVGFTREQRDEIWKNQEKFLERTIVFKCQLHGALRAPRLPVFLRWKDSGKYAIEFT